jgi:hypothetical protein
VYIEVISSTRTGDSLEYQISREIDFSTIDLIDKSKGMSRSGYLHIDRAVEGWASKDLEGKNLFWIEVSGFNDDTINIAGINLVFNDDISLSADVGDIESYKLKGDNSFIRYHVSARDEIVQSLRNGGQIKHSKTQNLNIERRNITKWDILDLGEIKNAAKYLTLSKIFFDVSRNVDDKAFSRYIEYRDKYGEEFGTFYLSLDKDDDGKKDNSENLSLNDATIRKI